MTTNATALDYALESEIRKRFPLDDLRMRVLVLEVETRSLVYRIDESIARCDEILAGIERARARLKEQP